MSDMSKISIPELVEQLRANDYGGQFVLKLTMSTLANRLEWQHNRIAELEADHERAVAMVIQAGIATGHADTSADLMAEVLHVVKNLRADNEGLRKSYDLLVMEYNTLFRRLYPEKPRANGQADE